MPSAQHYPEPTVGALIFDPAGGLFLMPPHKCGPKRTITRENFTDFIE